MAVEGVNKLSSLPQSTHYSQSISEYSFFGCITMCHMCNTEHFIQLRSNILASKKDEKIIVSSTAFLYLVAVG